MGINENLKEVREHIASACASAGRDANQVTLIAVSKTKPLEALMEAYHAGCRDFGENKVQEIAEKAPLMPEDVRFHMIGHLQRNKVKQVLPFVTCIHSVDSVRLAEQIQAECVKQNRTMDILLEVNVAEEESKYGFLTDEVLSAVKIISTFSHLHICGLMTIAPFVTYGEENRVFFKKLYQLSVDINRKNIDNVSMSVLSMGMSGDYQTAVEEGASMIRVGTGIFGAR